MRKTTQKISISLVLIFLFILGGCSKNDDNPITADNNYDFTSILNGFSENVVINTYQDLMNKTNALESACQDFNNDTTQAKLNIAADAWKAARAPWESSEAFIFGPVEYLSLDPSLDSWPVDRTQLADVLNSNFDLTPDFIRNGLGYSLRGFHTIEYLLFDNGKVKNAADFNKRSRQYLLSASTVLKEDAEEAYNEWHQSFAVEFNNAGKTGSRYSTQTQAVLEIVEGISGIADEVGNGKIGEPYTSKDVQRVESQFSWNSLTDFTNNIKSIKNAYTSSYNGVNGAGLQDFVKSKDESLNNQILSKIDSTIAAIDDIPSPFRNNLNNDTRIQHAIDMCNSVQNIFETKVKTLITQ